MQDTGVLERERVRRKPHITEPGDVDAATIAEIEAAMAGVEEEETGVGVSGKKFLSEEELDWAKRKATGTPYGRQRAQDPGDEEIREEYVQAHLNQLKKAKGFFGRILNWFRPNKLEGITVEKKDLAGKINDELMNVMNSLKEGKIGPNEARLMLEKRGIQMRQDEIEKLAAEMYAHQTGKLPPQIEGTRRHVQTPIRQGF